MADQTDIVELVKTRNPIEDVVAEDGYPLPQRGRYRKCTTAGTGGLVIDTQRQTYHWNTRGEWGDVIQWTMTFRRYDFKAAVEYLAQRAGLPAPEWGHVDHAARLAARAKEECLDVAMRVFRRWLEGSQEARAYAMGRGWTDSTPSGAPGASGGEKDEDGRRETGTIQKAMLGYSGEGTEAERAEMRKEMAQGGVDVDTPVAIAILGMRGDVVGWAKRHQVKLNDTWLLDGYIPGMVGHKRLVYPHVRNGRIVYLTGRSIDKKYHYNLPEALVGARQAYFNHVYSSGADEVVIVEGQADAVSLAQWGIDGVALAGVSVEAELGEALKRCKTVYVGLDADEAGQKNAWKVGEALGPLVRLVNWRGAPLRVGQGPQPSAYLDGEGNAQTIKDANDLLKSMNQAGLAQAGMTAEGQKAYVHELLKKAPTYIESLCAWAGEQEGAARDEAVRKALGVVCSMEEMSRAQYRQPLAKLLQLGVREYDHMLKTLKELSKKDNDQMTVIPTLGGPIGQWLVEYLYDASERKATLAWRDPEGTVGCGETVEIDGTWYGPYEPSGAILNGGVIFPANVGPLKPTRELVAYIEMFITSVYLLPSKTTAKIFAYYALLTWIYDCFNTIPYLRAMGEAGAGKSELMSRVGLVCYRLMRANGAGSSSSLFRSVEKYSGTVLIDEADLRDSDMSNDIVKFLNLGAMRNNPIWRMEEQIKPDGGKEFVEVTYRTFCPKLLAMRRDFKDDAVGSRALTFKIQPRETEELLAAGITLEINDEMRQKALALRNMLLRWRLEHWQPEIEIDPVFYDLNISSRLNQVTVPLMAVAKDDPDLQAEMRKFLREYYAEMVLSRSMTITARVIEAFWKIHKYPDLRKAMVVTDADAAERMLVGSVTRIANQIIDEMNGRDSEEDDGNTPAGAPRARRWDELSPQKIGRVIREELQLRVSERTNKGYWVFWDETRMSALAKRYGVNPEEIGKGPEATTGTPTDTPTGGPGAGRSAGPETERAEQERIDF